MPRVIEKVALPEPTGFDAPDKLDAFLDAVRWGAASTADVKNIQSPFRSGIEIEDYQLDPVVRAIQMPRVNLLIADDVGLGKTIEAGMVALELIIRHRARRMLVVCPSALQIQWRDQMRDKFGLDFRIVDSSLMRELRRRRGIHVNPWSHFPRLITSIDFLKRERPLRLFRETLPAPGEPIYPRKYDLLIVDEAHNCAPSGVGKYAADSLRTQALRELAPHFEHKLFLTATPHNGYRESFSALLELLDNQRFSRGTEPDRKQLDAVMVRRLKSDPGICLQPLGTSAAFRRASWSRLKCRTPTKSGRFMPPCASTRNSRSARAEDNAERFATEFVLKTLKKRLFSCPAAFLTTLEQHEKSLHTARQKGAPSRSYQTLQRELDRHGGRVRRRRRLRRSHCRRPGHGHPPVCRADRRRRTPCCKKMKDWAQARPWPAGFQGQATGGLAQGASQARWQVVERSGSSSSPNTGPRRTGCKRSWRSKGSPAATGC